MATEAESEPETGWDVVIHRAAQRELANVTGDEADELTHRLKQLQYYEQPTEPAYCEQLSDHEQLFRVRVEGYRAICRLNKPSIQVLAVGTRSRVYDKLQTVKNRIGGN